MNLVALSEVFEVRYGVNLDLNKLNKTSYALGVPFVSRTANNNGVSAYVEEVKSIAPNEGHTLSVSGGGSVLETFYQEEPYYSGRDLYVLKPINELNKFSMLAYAVYIKANKYRFNYGRQANKTLVNIKVPHPSEIKEIAESIKPPNSPTINSYKNSSLLLSIHNWKCFDLHNFFDMYAGKYYPKSSYIHGETPLVSVTTSSNGVMCFTDLKPAFDGCAITIGKVEGVAFFHAKPFCATSDVTVLKPKIPFNQFLGCFFATLINAENYKWSYGRQIRLNDSKRLKIKLPVNSKGEPDWQFMEDYIKSLPYSSNL